MKKTFSLMMAVMMTCIITTAAPKPQTLSSPDGSITVSVNTGAGISYSVSVKGQEVLSPSSLSLTLSDGTVYGSASDKLVKASKASVNTVIDAIVYRKDKVKDCYNELTLKYKSYSVVFRAYDDGVAYRFISASKSPFKVTAEQAEFAFAEDWKAFVPYVSKGAGSFESQFHSSFENRYAYSSLSGWEKERLAFLPLMVEGPSGIKLCISESDLRHYPGMYLYNYEGGSTLKGVFSQYPEARVPESSKTRIISMFVDGRKDYIADCAAGASLPWRVIAISTNDAQMADNDIIYRLAAPQAEGSDFSWVKPGKVAWDWWNSWNLYGVDFKTGVNTETYNYYVDFAAANGIEYVILDEGWSPGAAADLTKVIPEIDLDAIISHAEEKGVGIILWAGFYPFQRDIEGVCKHYAAKGVKGFKVDFMDSDDQGIVEFLENSAAIAAKYHLMMDYHGIYKPTGLSRTYPNIVNYEGVYGLENMKWDADADQVVYDVTIPYIRLFAGPADYTQGAMRNASKSNIRSVSSEGMSPGTRCHQLAEYVVFTSPLNMLCDSPSNYMGEPECTQFIAEVPTVWNETIALNGEVSKYITIARRSGDDWYLGSMTDWTARDITVDLSFLGEGNYEMVVFKDGVNADKAGRDYKKETIAVPASRQITIHMAPGGGYAAKIVRK